MITTDDERVEENMAETWVSFETKVHQEKTGSDVSLPKYR